ncbi:MAG: class I SAM-dependent methyltransferase [Vicinamibacterales bacterium]
MAQRVTYLEIGSYRGGSLQPHVLDPLCRHIVSIDPRPPVQEDESGLAFAYPGNSARRMLEALAAMAPDGVGKIRTFEHGVSDMRPDAFDEPPVLCFIDGEHTDDALWSDFWYCHRSLAGNGLIVCHDAPILYNGLVAIRDEIARRRLACRMAYLPDTIVAFEFGDAGLLDHPDVLACRADAADGYLFSLQSTDHYRRIARRWPIRTYRRLRAWWAGSREAD